MIVTNAYYAFENQAEAGNSTIKRNRISESLTLEVSGSATGFTMQVFIKADVDSDNFAPIGGVKLADYTVITEITANGLYNFVLEGAAEYYLSLGAIGGGTVSVYCRETRGE